MSIFFKSRRVGFEGREFFLYKIKTLDGDGTSSFSHEQKYTRFGKFLRKTHLDEAPQLWNVLKGDMNLFGWRPEEARTIRAIPIDMRAKLFSAKPGLIDLASIHFTDEGQMLEKSFNPHKTYWKEIRPVKYALQSFYIENKCFLLDLAIFWISLKIGFKKIFLRK